MRDRNTKADIPVEVVEIVPVAVGTARVPAIVDERTTAKHTVAFWMRSTSNAHGALRCHFDPAAKEFAHLGDHAGSMLILAFVVRTRKKNPLRESQRKQFGQFLLVVIN